MELEKTNIDPWSRDVEIKDYDQKIRDWGLSKFDDDLIKKIEQITKSNYMMRRGILFAHRDFEVILDYIKDKKPFVMMTGLMPSGKMHLGHKLVVDQMKWYQENGADLVIAISDVEAWMVRKIPPSKATKIAIEEYITNYLALGIEYKNHKIEVYSQWVRPELLKLAMAFSGKKTFGEMNSIYGWIKPTVEDLKIDELKEKPLKIFDWSVPAGKTFFPFIQIADILHPQLKRYGGPRPVVVPVGIDQDPHMMLTRSLAEEWRRYNLVPTEEHGYVAIYPQNIEDTTTFINVLEKSIIDLGIDKFILTESGEKAENILKIPNSNGLLIKSIGSGELSSLEEYLNSIEELKEHCYITTNRIGIFIRGEEDVEKLLSLAGKKIRKMGYTKIDIIPSYRALYIYDYKPIDVQKISEILIRIETELGLITFYKCSTTYNKLARGLTGGKMSSSEPNSAIFLTDTPEEVEYKIKNAQTGGRESIAKQKELGGEPEKCMVYELLFFNHPEDDFVEKIYTTCVSGELMCGDCKASTADYFKNWIKNLHEKRKELTDSGEIDRFVNEQDIIKEGDPLWW